MTFLLLSMTTLASGSFLAFHYPLGAYLALPGFMLVVLLQFYRPQAFLIFIPALLPIVGFYPWTGWLTFEELDLLVLATVAGGYAKLMIYSRPSTKQRFPLLLTSLATLMSLSILISMVRGFLDAGGFSFNWFQGYEEPLNSLRIGKSFFLALLLVPLLNRLRPLPSTNADRMLGIGLALGLGTASLAALAERLAFTGLLNFSSDYRTTALFWEMHVGGAALDGWLLLTFPFSVWALRQSRTIVHQAIALGLLGLATYASLTTFSRGVYLALLVSLPLLAWVMRNKTPTGTNKDSTKWRLIHWSIALLLVGLCAKLMFTEGGYRALLALAGTLAVLLSIPPVLRSTARMSIVTGLFLGGITGIVLIIAANFAPKGPYILYSILWSLSFAALYYKHPEPNPRGMLCAALFASLALATVNVAGYWGGIEALPGALIAIFLVAAVLTWSLFSRHKLWPDDPRWHFRFIGTSMATCSVIAVFSGGAYMQDRFSTYKPDFDNRMSHWSQAISTLHTLPEILLGKGLGRFPANFFFSNPDHGFPGHYGINDNNGNHYLTLAGANYPTTFTQILKVSQRLSTDLDGSLKVSLNIRPKTDVALIVEICEKHLLYPSNCSSGRIATKASPHSWAEVTAKLEGPLQNTGRWYAPAFKVLSLGVENQSGVVDIDTIALSSQSGTEIPLVNGDFQNEMQHWFFTSDRNHMPWHAKNLLVNLYFDQGLVGLGLFLLLTLCALWRLNFGKAKSWGNSPYFTSAIIGFLIVGMFDSLTDVPRLAFAYYLITLYALSYLADVDPKHL